MNTLKTKWIKLASVLVLGTYLAACGDTTEESEEPDAEVADETEEATETSNDNEETTEDEDHDHDHEHEEDHDEEGDHDHAEDEEHGHGDEHDAPETVTVEGIADHYHTGGLIELTAVTEEEEEFDHWHWYTRADESEEWEAVPEQLTEEFVYEAPEESFELRAVLFGDGHDAHVQSPVEEIIVDNH